MTPPQPSLSAAMIVKNEERFLEGCLRSLAGVVDEVVVVDTGSSDRTPEIARDLGARLFEFPWIDDFAAARNHSLEQARGDWILYIDADERVVANDADALARVLAEPRHAAATVRLRPITGFTPFLEVRLFRNVPRVRFRGRIHETFLPDLSVWMLEERLRMARSPLALDHLGYDGDLSHKHGRNLPLLEARLAEDPTHVFSWCHYGSTLAALGRGEAAEEAFRRGTDVVRGARARGANDALPFHLLVGALRRRGAPVAELLVEARRMFPRDATLDWLEARRLVDAGEFADAVPILARLSEIDGATFVDPALAHRQEIFGLWSLDALALCRFRIGSYAAAAEAWSAAARLAPADRRFAALAAVASSRAR